MRLHVCFSIGAALSCHLFALTWLFATARPDCSCPGFAIPPLSPAAVSLFCNICLFLRFSKFRLACLFGAAFLLSPIHLIICPLGLVLTKLLFGVCSYRLD